MLASLFSRIPVCYVSLYRLSLNLKAGNTLEKRTLLELYGAHMTNLFALVYYNSEIYLCTKISFVCKNENTLSLREIHLSNVLLNHLKCLCRFCSIL